MTSSTAFLLSAWSVTTTPQEKYERYNTKPYKDTPRSRWEAHRVSNERLTAVLPTKITATPKVITSRPTSKVQQSLTRIYRAIRAYLAIPGGKVALKVKKHGNKELSLDLIVTGQTISLLRMHKQLHKTFHAIVDALRRWLQAKQLKAVSV